MPHFTGHVPYKNKSTYTNEINTNFKKTFERGNSCA